MSKVNWQRCYEELSERFPEVEKELEQRLEGFFETNIGKGLISLENYPPHIGISFLTEGHMQRDEFKKKEVIVGNLISEVATRFNLNAKRGFYPTIVPKGEKKKIFYDDEFYVLSPNYKDFEK